MEGKTLGIALFAIEFLSFIATVKTSPIKQDLEAENNEQNISFEDKSFNKYTQELLNNYNNKNYFAAIYGDERTRDDFTKFLNEGLTQQVKDDLSGLRIYRKIGDAEVPVVMFSPQMDSWLGILPQWKRTKRYIFKKIEEYLSLHPEVLEKPQKPSRYNNYNFVKGKP